MRTWSLTTLILILRNTHDRPPPPEAEAEAEAVLKDVQLEIPSSRVLTDVASVECKYLSAQLLPEIR